MTRSSCRQKSTCCSERMERDGRWWWWWRRLRGGWCGLRLCAYLNRFHIKMQDINLKRQPADEESHAAFFLLCISTAIKNKKQKNFRQQLDSFEWQFNYANYYQSLPSVHRHRPPFPQLQPAEDRAAGTQLDGSEVMTCVTQRGENLPPSQLN